MDEDNFDAEMFPDNEVGFHGSGDDDENNQQLKNEILNRNTKEVENLTEKITSLQNEISEKDNKIKEMSSLVDSGNNLSTISSLNLTSKSILDSDYKAKFNIMKSKYSKQEKALKEKIQELENKDVDLVMRSLSSL